MRHNQRKDEEIIQKIRRLRGIRDSRSKQEIYVNIQEKMKREAPKASRSKKPVVLALSSAALIFLAVIVVSQFSPAEEQYSADTPSIDSNQNVDNESSLVLEEDATDDESTSDETSEEAYMQNDVEEGTEVTSDEEAASAPEERERRTDESDERTIEEEDTVTLGSDLHYMRATEDEASELYTLPFLAPDEETVVAVTVHSEATDQKEETFKDLLETINPDEFGLKPTPLQEMVTAEQEINENENTEVFASLTEVMQFESGTEISLVLGDRLEERNESNANSDGYYLLPVDQGYAFLVTGRSFNITTDDAPTFEETLKQMEENQERYLSIVPDEVELADVIVQEDDKVQLSYTGLEKVNEEEELVSFVEGLLFTAADHGFIEVEIEGVGVEDTQVGPYDMSAPLEPPVAPNYIGEGTDYQ